MKVDKSQRALAFIREGVSSDWPTVICTQFKKKKGFNFLNDYKVIKYLEVGNLKFDFLSIRHLKSGYGHQSDGCVC